MSVVFDFSNCLQCFFFSVSRVEKTERQVKRLDWSERFREKLGSVNVNATPVYFSSAAQQCLKTVYSVPFFFLLLVVQRSCRGHERR